MKYEVVVETKKEVLDPEGRAITSSLKNIGFSHINDIKVSKRFLLELKDETLEKNEIMKQINEIAMNHLCNTVAETYFVKQVEE